ncbi:tetratricopeptide repeat protein [Candidatus Chloroploca sp. Khr17]|uniref:tetratricopeptide repeat protein n=1 Tax=Candidatus Chloroploca sp. Khr17 TaxID=2496869 RepID=UPI00101BFC43|nr:tetratricopeptide repeat protein [Candidatus Chloroploca sp. Khr17]
MSGEHRLMWRGGIILLVIALALVVWWPRSSPDALTQADALFAAGRYYEALEAYQGLARANPAALLRVGMLRVIRGEAVLAERTLRSAMVQGLAPGDYHLALLYLGQALVDDGRLAQAERTWALLEDCRVVEACVYHGPGRVLTAEAYLEQGAYDAAIEAYRAALMVPMPSGWSERVHYRLALLLAGEDPDEALATLMATDDVETSGVLADPLLFMLEGDRAHLRAVLQVEERLRPQLLGQTYLEAGLYDRAITQFTLVDPDSPEGLSAAAYLAYAHWLAGHTGEGHEALEAMAGLHPDAPQVRALLALIAVAEGADDDAWLELDALAQGHPQAADRHLARASWYAAKGEYAQASLAYEQALGAAPFEEQGRYALLAARFHLATTYELCSVGLPLAERALERLPEEVDALVLVAGVRYQCGDGRGAIEAAQAAEAREARADAAFYLGAALAATGEDEAARAALIRASDLAPASRWRERAELLLATMPQRHNLTPTADRVR